MEHERDIDENAQLLVELLYGERDAETAELDDETRAELESLSQLRSLFRDVPDEEPPSGVSAKVLAAAANNAPKPADETSEPSGGVFSWLAGLFKPILMHPGLAAAASLVLVAGVAGALYVTSGNRHDVARPSVSSGQSAKERAADRGAPPATGTAPATEARDEADFGLDSDDSVADPDPDPEADEQAAAELSLDGESGAGAPSKPAKTGRASGAKRPAPSPPPRSRVRATRIDGVVGGDIIPAEPEPKHAGKEKAPAQRQDKNEARRFEDSAGESAGDSPPASSRDDRDELREREVAAPRTTSRSARKKKRESDSESAAVKKAKKLHGSAAAAASSGDCSKALKLGAQIRKLDSRYYDDVFLSDARIRKCREARTKDRK